MSDLDNLISNVYQNGGKEEDINKVHLAFLRTSFYIPIQSKEDQEVDENTTSKNEEPFYPLFARVNGHLFMSAFDSIPRLNAWAGEHQDKMKYVELKGSQLIAGINENVFLCLNLNTEFYKEFSPDELKRMKMIAAKIESFKNAE